MTWTDGIPAEVTLQVGEHWCADLRSGAGGGYLWTVEGGTDVAAGRIVNCRIVTGPLPVPGDPPNAVAAPVELEVVGVAPGDAVVRLQLARSWDPGGVLAQASMAVRVV